MRKEVRDAQKQKGFVISAHKDSIVSKATKNKLSETVKDKLNTANAYLLISVDDDGATVCSAGGGHDMLVIMTAYMNWMRKCMDEMNKHTIKEE